MVGDKAVEGLMKVFSVFGHKFNIIDNANEMFDRNSLRSRARQRRQCGKKLLELLIESIFGRGAWKINLRIKNAAASRVRDFDNSRSLGMSH
jgi:hypothetical protein